ncbi:hypothetical protein AAVH_25340 [Aphelenchoides avenae]|nr:hypothetical protein AAVH_25340 [Aphelenchus avenae]
MKRSTVAKCVQTVTKPRTNGFSKADEVNRRTSASLPAEVLLDIVHCVDYNTLVALCRTNRAFFVVVVQRNADVLAKRRRFSVVIRKESVALREGWARITEWRFDGPLSFVGTLKRMAAYVGLHQAAKLSIVLGLPCDLVISSAPALQFVESLHLAGNPVPAATDVEQFVSDFVNLRNASMFVCGRFDWGAFLRSEAALKLPKLVIGYHHELKGSDLLRYCLNFAHLPDGASRLVIGESFSRDFLLQCMSRFAVAERKVAVKTYSRGNVPALSADEFDVESLRDDHDNFSRVFTRYKARSSSVSVYVRESAGDVIITNDPSFDPFHH